MKPYREQYLLIKCFNNHMPILNKDIHITPIYSIKIDYCIEI